ncbi:MAG: FadR family transcriptional regulator [Desulfuromonas sp.]|nr:MAG: FadR family transcriptional regulator [Desulfuromonas sp.]
MTSAFKPIRPKKISEEIVTQIKALIAKGELRPGERIPSERDLASLLGVSRPSVREAIMVLEAMGFLESRQGGGTFVRALTETTIADPLARLMESKDPRMLHALTEVRMGLESWSAYLAALQAEASDIDELHRLYGEMETQSAHGGWDADTDTQFHYAITAATHNTVQIHLLDTIHSLFHATIQTALVEFYSKNGYREKLLAQHKEILDAISERDPERARQSMLDHLALVEEKMAQLLVNSVD